MNLNQSLSRAISTWPDRQAIADGQVSLTYKELGERVAALAAALKGIGVGRGDVVACIAPNCHEYLELYYACAFMGAVLNPLNFRLKPGEFVAILNDSDAKALFAHADFKDCVAEILAKDVGLKNVVWIGTDEPPKVPCASLKFEPFLMAQFGAELVDTNPGTDDLAQLYYTSGTTGDAKGVQLTHGNCAFNALGAIAELQFTDADVWLHVAPIFHLVDAWAIWAITWVGGKHVFLPYFKVDPVLQTLEREEVTAVALVPTMLQQVLAAHNVWEYSYPKLRVIMTAGSPVAPEQVRQISEVFRCDYVQFYGMTETSPFLTVSIPKAKHRNLPEHKLLEIKARTGRPFIGVDVRVVKDDGTDVACNNKEVGEIIARGPNVTPGYWNKPQQTADAIKNGWMHTGDLAVMDEDGYINIVDRKKDMIITGGENVYSTEVEYVLYEHAAVLECAVFGVPHDQWGEAVQAVVVVHKGMEATEKDIIDFVKGKLAHYKAPKGVEFAEELPKTGSGKIFKKGLRDRFWAALERKVR